MLYEVITNSSYFFVQQEQVIDFNSDPAISMMKIDTVYEYNLRENPRITSYNVCYTKLLRFIKNVINRGIFPQTLQ